MTEETITSADNDYLEELVMHFLSMVGEYEYTQGYGMCFTSQIDTKDGRVLTIDLRSKEDVEQLLCTRKIQE